MTRASQSVPTDASSTSGSVAVFDGLTNLTDVPDYTDLNQAPYVNVTVGVHSRPYIGFGLKNVPGWDGDQRGPNGNRHDDKRHGHANVRRS